MIMLVRHATIEDCDMLGLVTVTSSLKTFLGNVPEEDFDFSWTPAVSAANWREYDQRLSCSAALEEVAANTPESEMIFVIKELGKLDYTIFRLTNRDVFVSWKFVPVTTGSIQDWYERFAIRDNFPLSLPELQQKYSVNYLLLPESDKLSSMPVIWSGNDPVLQVTAE